MNKADKNSPQKVRKKLLFDIALNVVLILLVIANYFVWGANWIFWILLILLLLGVLCSLMIIFIAIEHNFKRRKR